MGAEAGGERRRLALANTHPVSIRTCPSCGGREQTLLFKGRAAGGVLRAIASKAITQLGCGGCGTQFFDITYEGQAGVMFGRMEKPAEGATT